MKYKVSVEKRMYCTGTVEVDCDNPDQAEELVQEQINSSTLRVGKIKWGKPQYEDFSFATTGDVN